MAEWSKALVLGTSHFDGVGSNPTAAKENFCNKLYFFYVNLLIEYETKIEWSLAVEFKFIFLNEPLIQRHHVFQVLRGSAPKAPNHKDTVTIQTTGRKYSHQRIKYELQ